MISDYSVRNATKSFRVELCNSSSGIFSVLCFNGLSPTEVYVTTTSVNNWMVIHQNLNSSFSWNLSWADYKTGFGSSFVRLLDGALCSQSNDGHTDYRLDEIKLLNSSPSLYMLSTIIATKTIHNWDF